MKLPELQITKTMMKIGINQSRGHIELRQPMAEIEYNQPQPEVKMTKTKSKLEIDQSEAFADANLKNPFRVIKEWASEAKKRVLLDIAKEISQGNRMMTIEHQDKSIIPQLAKEDSQPAPKQFNIGFMPETAEKVHFKYTPSKITMDVDLENFKLKAKINKPQINFQRGHVSIYTKQKASIDIQAIGINMDIIK
ncbi:DUF6470 family protein [Bacillus sp. 31A1R]|uniref:DUF6470 family protein n=1 Tax=Robertmurraya mangrovi TaxID=3098077 RepID=A0ABU5IXS9_9BACI|nr:DUF6470 family protein [Bacillus sp. 31A1R]MDZ5471954.1 DUF6470 family protein [Bacillus sp. 31A1R]